MTNDEPGRHISQIETIWPVLRQAHDGNSLEVIAAQETILQRYRPAVYRYLQACLRDNDAADEVCQEFSLRLVRGDFRNANPKKGRFRDLLKSALYHLVVDYHKRKRRVLPQLPLDDAEPVVVPESTFDSDRQFLLAWRSDLLLKAWDELLEEEERTGRPLHTALFFAAEHPELTSGQMAEQLASRLGKPVTADQVRQWLHGAREKFAERLLKEVIDSLGQPNLDTIVAELIDLKLFEYCKVVWARCWRSLVHKRASTRRAKRE